MECYEMCPASPAIIAPTGSIMSNPLAESPSGSTVQQPTLHVLRWHDSLIDRLGHDSRSRYVERFWLGILGPSTTSC